MKNIIIVCLMILIGCSHVQAQTWSLVGDLNFTSNPNSAWSYGWSWMGPEGSRYIGQEPDTTVMNLYDTARTPWDGAGGSINTGWVGGGSGGTWFPCLVKLAEGSSYYWAPTAPGGSVWITGGGDTGNPQWSVIRWTAPAAGNYTINATLGGGYTGWHHTIGIIKNKTTQLLYKFNTLAGTDWSYSGTLTLNGGDTIDLIAGMGNATDAVQGTWTTVNATITGTPAPRLLNGGFENGTTSGWTIYNPYGYSVNWGVTTTPSEVNEGTYAARLAGYGAGSSGQLIILNGASVADLPAGALVETTVYLKLNNFTLAASGSGLGPKVAAYNGAGAVLGYSWANGTFGGTTGYIPIKILFELPAGTTRLELQLTLAAGITSGSVDIDHASMEVVSLGPVAADAALCQVRRDLSGTPRLWVKGQMKAPLFFFANMGSTVVYDEYVKAAGANVNMIMLPMVLPWYGTGTGMVAQAIEANPNAMIFPRIAIDPTQAWIDAHPDQRLLNENGLGISNYAGAPNFASLASDSFIAEVKHQIETLIRYLHNGPYKDRIMGYTLTYLQTAEWFYPDLANNYVDFSEVNRQKFISWLMMRYMSIGQLNTAWGSSYAAFSQVQIPAYTQWELGDDGLFRNPALRRNVTDYQLYHNELVALRLDELAAHVKQLTSNRSLVSYFFGYHNELIGNGSSRGTGHSGHNAVLSALDSNNIDIIGSPISYYDRGVGGPAEMMSIVDSATLAGKIWMQEDDSRTYLWTTPAPEPSMWYSTEWDTLQCLGRNFGDVLSHNQAIEWMDLNANGSFNGVSIWQNNQKLVDTYNDSMQHNRASRPQIALIYDEDSVYWLKANCYGLTLTSQYIQRSIFQEAGAQVGYYYIQDLPRIPNSVKLFIFVNAFHIDANEMALINAIKGDGHTIVWEYAPGYVTDSALSITQMQNITGFSLAKSTTSTNARITIVSSVSPITTGLEGQYFGDAAISISPTFYGTGSGYVTLGRYANSTSGLLLKDFSTWKSIFCGAPTLSVPLLRSIAKDAGIQLLVDPTNLNTADAVKFNGRYLYIYARDHNGNRSFHVPEGSGPVNVTEVLSGAEVANNVISWTSSLAQNEEKIFKLTPVMDLGVFVNQWLVSGGYPTADFSGDGMVNFTDFAIFMNSYW